MLRKWIKALSGMTWLRITLAVALLMFGLAFIGAPILSDSSWRVAPAEETGPVAQPFIYRWTNDGTAAEGMIARVERSDDGGKTWHGIANLPEAVAQIEPVRGDEQVVFARTATAIWGSRDGGVSWAQAATLPSKPQALAVSGTDANLLLVGTESAGLLLSRDFGTTWQADTDPLLSGGGGAATAVTALSVNPADDTILYAATGIWLGTSSARLTPLGIFVSADGGQHWTTMEQLPLDARPVTQLTPVAGQPLTAIVGDDASTHTVTLTATPELLAALDSDDAGVRAATARLLGLIGDPTAAPALLTHITDADALAGNRAAEALGRVGNREVVPDLLTALEDPNTDVRARAATSLGLLKVEAAVPQLGAMLLTDDSPARNRAAEALAQIGTRDALEALAQPLTDRELTPQRQAAMSGLELAGGNANEVLIAMLQADDAPARANAAEMLGWIKADPATANLAEALYDEDAAVRSQAAWALGEIGSPSAQQALAAALKVEGDTTARAAVSAALDRSERADMGEAARFTWGEALLGELTHIPTSRWTVFALFLLLAVALLTLGPRKADVRVRR